MLAIQCDAIARTIAPLVKGFRAVFGDINVTSLLTLLTVAGLTRQRLHRDLCLRAGAVCPVASGLLHPLDIAWCC